MAKKLLFTLFICFLSLFSNNLFSNTPLNGENGCNTPPPDSIRVIGMGSTFTTLAWTSTQAGADHYLSLFEENASGGWDSLYTVFVENVTTHTFTDFPNGKNHLVKIRTACEDGGPSTASASFFPPIGVIVELILDGRSPSSSTKQFPCTDLFYPTNETDWIGFVIKKTNSNGTSNLSYFEYNNLIDKVGGRIRRVQANNPLVSANQSGEYPQFVYDTITSGNEQFKIGETNSGSFTSKGTIKVTWYNNRVNLCPDMDEPLAPNFTFTILRGTAPSNKPVNFTPFDLFAQGSPSEDISITNPFSGNLNIFSMNPLGLCDITIFDLNGKRVYIETIDLRDTQVSIPQASLKPGIYILQISNGSIQKNFKIIKSAE